jgi:hypothetical protein
MDKAWTFRLRETVWKIVLFLPVFCPTIGAHLIETKFDVEKVNPKMLKIMGLIE